MPVQTAIGIARGSRRRLSLLSPGSASLGPPITLGLLIYLLGESRTQRARSRLAPTLSHPRLEARAIRPDHSHISSIPNDDVLGVPNALFSFVAREHTDFVALRGTMRRLVPVQRGRWDNREGQERRNRRGSTEGGARPAGGWPWDRRIAVRDCADTSLFGISGASKKVGRGRQRRRSTKDQRSNESRDQNGDVSQVLQIPARRACPAPQNPARRSHPGMHRRQRGA